MQNTNLLNTAKHKTSSFKFSPKIQPDQVGLVFIYNIYVVTL